LSSRPAKDVEQPQQQQPHEPPQTTAAEAAAAAAAAAAVAIDPFDAIHRMAFPVVASWNIHPDLAPFVRSHLSFSDESLAKAAAGSMNILAAAAKGAASGNDDPNHVAAITGSGKDDDALSLIRQQQQFLQQQQKFKAQMAKDTGLSVVLLGTGAGAPSLEHGNPAAAVRMPGATFLVDAGEGVQVALMKSRIKGGSIRKIFSTSGERS
jgi:hypothetical protein